MEKLCTISGRIIDAIFSATFPRARDFRCSSNCSMPMRSFRCRSIPPAHLAAEFGGEAKTEFWYIADATQHAELFVGLRNSSSRDRFVQATESGDVSSHVHRIPVRTGDALLLPSGRLHAIGAGNLIVEIQQNSDTTYRVFDWNRLASDGKPRQLHIEEALRCIDFEDREPKLLNVVGELLVRNSLFEIQQWDVTGRREIAPSGRFAILFCLAGDIVSGGIAIQPGEFALIPAAMPDRYIQPRADVAKILRVTVPA